LSNTDEEIDEKRALYFEKGAQEFWLCDQDGEVTYFDHSGKIARSSLFPNFPQEIDLDA
jgi:Uma2 family endonuclease